MNVKFVELVEMMRVLVVVTSQGPKVKVQNRSDYLMKEITDGTTHRNN